MKLAKSLYLLTSEGEKEIKKKKQKLERSIFKL